MSAYKFLAWTSPGLQNVLVEELSRFNISATRNRLRINILNLAIYPSSAVFFTTTMENLHNLLYKPTCITYLNLRINRPIQARNMREFANNMRQIQLHPYIPLNANFNIRLSVKRCNRNHSSSWQDVITNYIQDNIQNRKSLIENKQLLLGNEQRTECSDAFSPKIPLQINAYLYQNYITLYIQLHLESLHKFGFKKYANNASLSENIADAILHFCQVTKGTTIWDPFCGSGTLILTLLAREMGKTIRKGQFLPLYQLPIFKDYYKEEPLKELEINLLANDIDVDQLKGFYRNLDDFPSLKRIIRQQSPQLRCKSYQNLSVAQLDYKSMYQEFIKNNVQRENLMVISNPPWGRTVNLDKFHKMITFMEHNCQQCYLLISSDQYQFFDKNKWELLAEPLVGGQWTKIIKFDRNRKLQLIQSNSELTSSSSQIITQSSTTDITQQNLTYQRDISEYENKKTIELAKNIKALSKKINNPDFLKHLSKEMRAQATKHQIYLTKLHIGTKTKIRSIMLRRADQLYKAKIRNFNLKIKKLKEQLQKEQIEMKKQEVKDKVILDKYKIKEDDLEKIQQVLDEKAKRKSVELLRREKKRVQTIPKW